MEVKIGIQNVSREISVDTDASADEVTAAFTKALADDGILTVTDSKGGQALIRAEQVAYLDLGKETARKVGFGAV